MTIDGDPWFVVGDIRDLLGVKQSGPNFSFLDKDEVQVIKRYQRPDLFASLKRVVWLTLNSESGLFKFLMRGDKPEAKDFQNWATKVVLPSIHKNGGYIRGQREVARPLIDSFSSLEKPLR